MAVKRTRKTAATRSRKKAAGKSGGRKRAAATTAAKGDNRATARAKLGTPKPRKPSRFEMWLTEPANAAAKVFVETWLDMTQEGDAASGGTDYVAADVLRDLVADFELPFRDPTGFGRRMYEIYGDRWLAAKAASGK